MKQNYKVLDKKTCKGIRFRIVKDLDVSKWQYIIQQKTNCKGRYKKLWKFQKYEYVLNEFECEGMLKRVDWLEKLK